MKIDEIRRDAENETMAAKAAAAKALQAVENAAEAGRFKEGEAAQRVRSGVFALINLPELFLSNEKKSKLYHRATVHEIC